MSVNHVSKENIEALMETIRNLYLSDDIPWVIGYSGGKDSTATLQLVWLSLSQLPEEQRTKKVHIINTDTRVESPVVSKWVHHSIDLMNLAITDQALPFITHILSPDFEQTFWVNLLGRGYPFPRRRMRWCTDRLKIQPVNSFITGKIAEHGEIILVLGTRKAESANRARSMERLEKKRVRELLSPNPTLANELVFSPLEDWNDGEVWAFLMQYKNPWGLSNTELLTLYKGATQDGECPIMVDNSQPSCGNSRFGCWVCTVVSQDKSMQAMIQNDAEKKWMEPLLNFRNEFGNVDQDKSRRSYRVRSGAINGFADHLYHGPYVKSVRDQWLRKLLELQKSINEEGPKEFQNLELITVEELRIIRRIWVKENHEFDDSVPRIYEQVFKTAFDDPDWEDSTNYGIKEWNLLKQVCEELCPDEELAFEMMYSLLDLEAEEKRSGRNKETLEKLEDQIRKTFYKNEEDALNYYSRSQYRRKKSGAKHNPRFIGEVDQSSSKEDRLEEDEEAVSLTIAENDFFANKGKD